MLRVIVALFGTVLFLVANPAYAYVWKCHTPNGDIWTSQPAASDDCVEYDDKYNPNAAPPATQSPPPQIAPQAVPPPPPYVGAYLPAPYYYNPGYYGPGVYLAPRRSATGMGDSMGGVTEAVMGEGLEGVTEDAIGVRSGATASLC